MTLHVMPTRQRPLDDAMDLDAPKGSAPWARAIRMELLTMWHSATTDLQRFRNYLRLFEDEQGYRHLDNAFGHPFPSLYAFCVAPPPHGLGYDPDLLDRLQKDTRELTLGEWMADIKPLEIHGTNQHREQQSEAGGVVQHLQRGSTNKTYLIARLKRDKPEIAQALARGEYPSVRAAAKAAGLVHEPTPLDYLHRYWRKVSPEDRLRFLTEMLTPNERRALVLGCEEDLG